MALAPKIVRTKFSPASFFPCGILFAHETAGSTLEVFLSARFSKHPELGELD